jgi:hypothetical protein
VAERVPPAQFDEVAIERALYNLAHDLDIVPLTRPEIIEVVRRAPQHEVSLNQIATAYGLGGPAQNQIKRLAKESA